MVTLILLVLKGWIWIVLWGKVLSYSTNNANVVTINRSWTPTTNITTSQGQQRCGLWPNVSDLGQGKSHTGSRTSVEETDGCRRFLHTPLLVPCVEPLSSVSSSFGTIGRLTRILTDSHAHSVRQYSSLRCCWKPTCYSMKLCPKEKC